MNILVRCMIKTMVKHRFACFGSSLRVLRPTFFPVPPDVMLIPMSMSKPKGYLRFALYTTIASVVGGMIGMLLVTMPFDWVQGYIQQWGYKLLGTGHGVV